MKYFTAEDGNDHLLHIRSYLVLVHMGANLYHNFTLKHFLNIIHDFFLFLQITHILCVHLVTFSSLHSAINREQHDKYLLLVWILQKI